MNSRLSGTGLLLLLFLLNGCNVFDSLEDKNTREALDEEVKLALDVGDNQTVTRLAEEKLETLEKDLAADLKQNLGTEKTASVEALVEQQILDSLKQQAVSDLKAELRETEASFVDSLQQAIIDSLTMAGEQVDSTSGAVQDAIDEVLNEKVETEAEQKAQEQLNAVPEEEIEAKKNEAIIQEAAKDTSSLTEEQKQVVVEYSNAKRDIGQAAAGEVIEGGVLDVAEDVVNETTDSAKAEALANSASDDGEGTFVVDSVDAKIADLTKAISGFSAIPEAFLTKDDKRQIAVTSLIRITLNIAGLVGEDTGADTVRVSKSGIQALYGSQNPSYRSQKDLERVGQISEDIFRASKYSDSLDDSAKEDAQELEAEADPNGDGVVSATEAENYVKSEYLNR
jgi:hypothetical protein